MPLCLATLFRFLKARRAPFPHRSSSCRALDGKSGCRRESIQRLLCSQTDATLRKTSQQNVNITGRHLLGHIILVLLIATCSWDHIEGFERVAEGCFFVWFFTGLFCMKEENFYLPKFSSGGRFFCNFVNSFCWSSLICCWRLPDHNAVEAQNCFCHQLHFVVPVGTKSEIRN